MLENGTHTTVTEIAAAEKINESYVGRVLRLTLLTLDIVEAVVGGRQSADLQLEDLLRVSGGVAEAAGGSDQIDCVLLANLRSGAFWPRLFKTRRADR
jgi:hypothetical protein